jgi:RIO-like serine/threonine protein kinase
LETADLMEAAQQKPSDAPTPIDAVQQRVVMERLDGLEADLQKTNNKLDLILQLLQNRVEHTSNTPL